jgi:hypothetical protein
MITLDRIKWVLANKLTPRWGDPVRFIMDNTGKIDIVVTYEGARVVKMSFNNLDDFDKWLDKLQKGGKP